MFGLEAIDFSGLLGLSGDISSGELFDRFRSALTPGVFGNTVSDDQIRTMIDYVFSNYDVIRLSTPLQKNIADQIRANVTTVVKNTLPSNFWTAADSVVGQLQNEGFAVVPKGYSQASPTGTGPTPPVVQQRQQQGGSAVAQQDQSAPQIQGRTPAKRIQRPRTKAENTKLYWVLGIGAVMFAIAIGVIALRD